MTLRAGLLLPALLAAACSAGRPAQKRAALAQSLDRPDVPGVHWAAAGRRIASVDTAVFARHWLLQSCAMEGDPPLASLLREVARQGFDLETPLLAAWERGPPREVVRDLDRVTRTRYRDRNELLRAAEGLGMAQEQATRMRAVTLAQYVHRARVKLDGAYRSRAASGLAVLGGARARGSLERVAADARSPYRASAETALEILNRTQ